MSQEMAERLRQAIRDSGLSANELAARCGVPQTTISRFMRGHDMGIHRASKVAAYLGLRLTGGRKKF